MAFPSYGGESIDYALDVVELAHKIRAVGIGLRRRRRRRRVHFSFPLFPPKVFTITVSMTVWSLVSLQFIAKLQLPSSVFYIFSIEDSSIIVYYKTFF